MDIKKYEMLLEVIDKGSFIRACADQGYTQPGITHMMNSLEKEVGFPLLLRSNRGIHLTPEGEDVLPAIRELVRARDNLEQQYSRIRGAESGRLRVGSYLSTACVWLPRIIRLLRDRYPGITVEIHEDNSIHRLVRDLQSGQLDICLFNHQPGTALDWLPLKQDPYLAVLPTRHPLARKSQIKLKELLGNDEAFLVMKSTDGVDPVLVNYFDEQGVPLVSRYTSNSDGIVVNMISQGLGVSILPELSLQAVWNPAEGDVAVRPLAPPVARELGLAVRSLEKLSPAMERFISCTRELFASEND